MSAIVYSLSILWHCLSLGLEWKLTFSSPMATAEFSKFADILSAAHGVTKSWTWLSDPSLQVTLHQTGPWCCCQWPDVADPIIDPQPLSAAYQLHWHLDPHLPEVFPSSRPWNISVTWLFLCLTGPSYSVCCVGRCSSHLQHICVGESHGFLLLLFSPWPGTLLRWSHAGWWVLYILLLLTSKLVSLTLPS